MKKFLICSFLTIFANLSYATVPLESLNDSHWILAKHHHKDQSITLNFSNGRIHGKAPCNFYSGIINNTEQDTINISSLMVTKMACADRTMKQESIFLRKLGSTYFIEQPTKDSLYLYNQYNHMIFKRNKKHKG